MKLIIEIDEDVRIAISRMGLLRISEEMQKKVDRAIQHGTPLSKGHGRILDVDKLMDEIIRKRVIDDGHIEKWIQEYIDNDAEIIIEADKESEEV